MDPLHREVSHARRAEGAPVAHAVPKDAPGEQGIPFVLPRGAHDLPVVVGLRESQAEGDVAHVLGGHRSPPGRHLSPEPETAYLSFPALFNSVRVPGFVRSGLILAGGRSRRFGGPKALVEIEGRPSIARVADALAPLVAERIVSIEGPRSEPGIRSLLPDAAFVHDARPNRGPTEGFRQGFRVARGDIVLV